MAEPACLNLAKKIVRLMERHEDVAFAEKKRALVLADTLFESGHYAPGSGQFFKELETEGMQP